MGTKSNPGEFDCYAEAQPDEPVFVLLGRDPNAPIAIRAWAEERQKLIQQGKKPMSDMRKVGEALACALEMQKYNEAMAAHPQLAL